MKFPLSLLHELSFEENQEYQGSEVCFIRSVYSHNTRWSRWYDMLFSYNGRFYQFTFDVGATENQDSMTFDNIKDEDMAECNEMEKYEKTVTAWRPVEVRPPAAVDTAAPQV